MSYPAIGQLFHTPTMAITGIDHVIVIGRDLDALTAECRALGFTVTPGGRHARATHNALVPFADGAYIELLAFWEPAPETRRWAMLEAGGGLSEFMLTSDDVAADIAAAYARGVDYGAPVAGTRIRPDGVEVAWRDGPAPAGGALPFLIEDVTERTVRVPAGNARVHANGVRGLARLTLAVADLDSATRDYAALLGTEPTPGVAAAEAVTLASRSGPTFSNSASRVPAATWRATSPRAAMAPMPSNIWAPRRCRPISATDLHSLNATIDRNLSLGPTFAILIAQRHRGEGLAADMSTIGKVDGLWRYPVKSMRGEALAEAYVSFSGIYGDRIYAFKSTACAKVFPYLTGREQARLLLFEPRFRKPDLAAKPVNWAEAAHEAPGLNACFDDPDNLAVDVETPSGEVLAIDDPALIAALRHGLDDAHEVSLLRSDRALTDCRPVSLIATQTVDQLGDEISAALDPRRFRANVYMNLESGEGFDEDGLVGRTLAIGSDVRLTVVARDPRCKMITLDPDTAEADPRVLRKVARGHGGLAGIYGAVVREGVVRRGDAIQLTD